MRHTNNIFFLIVFGYSNFISAQETFLQKTKTFVCHPLTVLTSSLCSFGTYAWYNQPARKEAYSWIKERWQTTPTLIKYPVAALGLITLCYNTYIYFSNHQVGIKNSTKQNLQQQQTIVFPSPLENEELRGYIQSFAKRISLIETDLEMAPAYRHDSYDERNFIQKTRDETKELGKKIEQIHEILGLLSNVKKLDEIIKRIDSRIEQLEKNLKGVTLKIASKEQRPTKKPIPMPPSPYSRGSKEK